MSNLREDSPTYFRPLHPGMGQAVAERTYLRKKADGSWESWGDVAHRVALGNSLLCKTKAEQKKEYELLNRHIAKASALMSGRHLQQGDETQPTRNQEIFCNCATAATSFALFYLLLNGTGVGRCYDDDLMLVDWNHSPNLRCVLDNDHPDFDWSAHESVRDARHKYTGDDVMWFEVPDSREGWAQALEIWENSTWEKVHRDKMLILDFSKVRPAGAPIGGMQSRPASGPVPLMNAFLKAASLKGSGLSKWRQSIYLDHYFAECVLVGGARRAARMSTKFWKDSTVIGFIEVKRPIEFSGKNRKQVEEYLADNSQPMGFLWSSNNSVTVDQEFWDLVALKRGEEGYDSELAAHARKVFRMVSECSYGDGTGEPGFINTDKLLKNNEGWEELTKQSYMGSAKYQVRDETELFLNKLAKKALRKKYNMITNPCGEIALTVLGGYCVIGDVVPFFADSLDDAEEAFRAVTRALIRTNTLDSLYSTEVSRTNRIGVGITGVHEFAWKFFGHDFNDLVDEKKSKDFWDTMARFSRAVHDEAVKYSEYLGVAVPHTATTVKPSGTISKLFGLTEGWHLPAMKQYLRWVQFRNDDPLVSVYQSGGYPVRKLRQYEGTTIVGFPTQPVIAEVMPENRIITAGEASPEDQYKWLMLGERYWLKGDQDEYKYNNQISFTLKYDPATVDFNHFKKMMKKYQSQIICCSVMPQQDAAAYEYQPEEAITKVKYQEISEAIREALDEAIDKSHLECEGGACPIEWKEEESVPTIADLTEAVGREHLECEGGACPIEFKETA